ncbi:AAA family ATPase [archaeon]|nr:AAA family ATPase [archaeon]
MNEKTVIDFLSLQNKWWYKKEDFPDSKTYDIRRSDFYFLNSNCTQNEKVLVLVGPRGVGKSTTIFEMMKDLINTTEPEVVDKKRILYITFEQPSINKIELLDLLKMYSKYILKEDIANLDKKIYVFFDEIQNVKSWGDQLKVIKDLDYPIKFVVSGSSSVSMVDEASKGARRFYLYSMHPLKFCDFLRFKIPNDPDLEKFILYGKTIRDILFEAIKENNISKIYDTFLQFYNDLKPWQTKIELLFQDYLIRGGYPGFLEADYMSASTELNQTFRLGFHKDLMLGKGIGDPQGMGNLVEYIASISSSETNYTALMKKSGATTNTGMLKKYLYHLQYSFLVKESHLMTNAASKTSNSFKIYLIDVAVRNMLMGLMNNLLSKDQIQTGYAIETVIYDHAVRLLYKINPTSRVSYWKNKRGEEVDIVLKSGIDKIGIEVKKADAPNTSDLNGLKSFCKKYKIFGIVACGNQLDVDKEILFLPHWLFCMIC